MITKKNVYKLHHSFIHDCVSIERIVIISDSDSGLIHETPPHTCAFSPLQYEEVVSYLNGECDPYLEVITALWTDSVKEAYSERMKSNGQQ